jgi:hypothetical protein
LPRRLDRAAERLSEDSLFPEHKRTMAAAAVYGGFKGKLGVEDAPELQLNRIRITLSSKNVKNLEKGITKPHEFTYLSQVV